MGQKLKLNNWEENLNKIIQFHIEAGGDYKVTNCWLLALDAYEAQTGIKLFLNLRKYKDEKAGYKLFAKQGFKTVGQALESILTATNKYSAMRGDLATFILNGVESCGVITANGLVTKTFYKDGTFGMTYLSLDKIDKAYKVE